MLFEQSFFCPHAVADSNYRIRIREKMLEFSSTALPGPSLYTLVLNKENKDAAVAATPCKL